jgi:hypothetical protein
MGEFRLVKMPTNEYIPGGIKCLKSRKLVTYNGVAYIRYKIKIIHVSSTHNDAMFRLAYVKDSRCVYTAPFYSRSKTWEAIQQNQKKSKQRYAPPINPAPILRLLEWDEQTLTTALGVQRSVRVCRICHKTSTTGHDDACPLQQLLTHFEQP